MLAALALTLLTPPAETVTLVSGLPVRGETYFSVRDTTLDADSPDMSLGGLPYLEGGPRRTILIHFGELRRALGPNRKILRASLVLTPTGPSEAQLTRVDFVRMPWGEGPFTGIGARMGAADPKAAGPSWAATWKGRRSGTRLIGWQLSGAAGPEDTQPIASAKGAMAGKSFVVDGLAEAVQAAVDRPWADYGWALRFSGPVEFYSSQYPTGRPTLLIEAGPSAPNQGPDLSVRLLRRNGPRWEAEVVNQGTKASSGFTVEWWIDERRTATEEVLEPLAPGATRTLGRTIPLPRELGEPRTRPVEIRVLPKEDTDLDNNRRLAYEGANLVRVALDGSRDGEARRLGFDTSADWAQDLVRRWNEVAAERSRFAAFPDGVLGRVVIDAFGEGLALQPAEGERANWARIAEALGLGALAQLVPPAEPVAPRDFTRWAGITGAGDARYDGSVPTSVPLPLDPEFNPLLNLLPPAPTGPLSAVEVALLNARLADPTITPSKLLESAPKTALVTLKTLAGVPVEGAKVRVLQADGTEWKEVTSAVTERGGQFIVPGRDGLGPFGALKPDLSNGLLLVEASKEGLVDRRWIPVWRTFDLAARSKLPAVLFDVRVDLPMVAVDRGADVATNRLISDSAGTSPATLARLLDGSPDEAIPLPASAGSWLELDLGRDRTIGEIELVSTADLPSLDVRVYSTGEKVEDADVWFTHPDYGWLRRHGVPTTPGAITLRGPAARVRYVRVVNVTGGAWSLQAIRIRPARLANDSPALR